MAIFNSYVSLPEGNVGNLQSVADAEAGLFLDLRESQGHSGRHGMVSMVQNLSLERCD